MLPRWRSRVRWIRGQRRRRYFFRTNPFPISFPVCSLDLLPAAITSRRSKKSRETFAREFANFSTRSVARNDGARIIRAAISQSSRTRRSERLDARLISAIGGKSNEIYIVDTNQLASVHGSRGHESSVTSQPFRRSRRARNAGNQWCNPTALSLSRREQLTASRKIGEDESSDRKRL